nr:hypothetical protein Iba_chr13eCG10080 [Ipomoea batatas]
MFLCMIEWNPGVLLRSNFLYLSEALSWIDARMVLGAYVDDLIIFRTIPRYSVTALQMLNGGIGADCREFTEVKWALVFYGFVSNFCVLIDHVGFRLRKTTTKTEMGRKSGLNRMDYGVKWAFGFLWLRLHFMWRRVVLLKRRSTGNGKKV